MRLIKKLHNYLNSGKWISFENFGIALILISSIFLIFSGTCKILGLLETKVIFNSLKLQNYRVPIGVCEILVSILLFIPKLSQIGIFFLAILTGGAISVHLSYLQGQALEGPIIILICVTLGYIFRNLHKIDWL